MDAGMTRLLPYLMVLTAVGSQWDITWDAHPDNTEIRVVTDCTGKVPFRAVDAYPVEPTQTHIQLRRQLTPANDHCSVYAAVIRGETTDPDHPNIGESTYISEVE